METAQDNQNSDLSVQTLITTMHLTDYASLISKMNIKHNYIIGNQSDCNSVQKCENNGIVISTDLRGVGQNRNNIIERATSDICVLADDDMCFCDEYETIVKKCFAQYSHADVIIFNFISESKGRRVVNQTKKIGFHNYMNYGAARIAFRRKSLAYHSILFNTMLGGGTPHQCGEDSLFINACLRSGLNVIAVPDALASLTEERESTWFKGYNEKYFYDKGVFLAMAHPKLCKVMAALLIMKHKEYVYQSNMSYIQIYKVVSNGIAHIKRKTFQNITN